MFKHISSTLFGLVFGASLIVGSVFVSGHAELFWNVPSAFIIFGGTIGATIMAFPPQRLKTIGTVIKKSFSKEEYDLRKDIAALVRCAEISRKDGLLALENHIDELTDDAFLKQGIQYIVDGADEEQLRNLLEGSTYFMKQRHQKGAAMLDMIAATAPALGLLGTYVGLIPMLNNLDDASTLGPMMALELVSSFYGAFVAYVIFAPLAKRLKFMNKEEETRRELLIEGLADIQQGKNPRIIREELLAYANMSLDTEKEKEKEKEGETDGKPKSRFKLRR
ncbi:MotA/TolQ/ExbB proton channel family protein [Lachnospiraceae bacterium 54-53]